MGYYLTIDQGNSAAKLVLWQGSSIVHECNFEHLDGSHIFDLASRFPVDAAIYCSVAGDGNEIVTALKQVCRQVMTLSHDTPVPVRIGYATPRTLGKDRIAAAVGAWSMYSGRTIFVVDMGTAVTYDVVTADGCFLGGNIAPGALMRLDALNHFTARLPRVAIEGDTPLWGVDTETAMRSGAIYGIAAEVSYFRKKLPDDAVVVLTGYLSGKVGELLDFPVKVEPHLVTKGLNTILIYNETK
ncbi:MAG: type III pantothenate kinase [Muribaculaceae bacterium]|nr:type III pantothenate kinase [Muribaculaceae bacterium]